MGNCASVSHLNAELKNYRIVFQTDAQQSNDVSGEGSDSTIRHFTYRSASI
jgi:hypothetical protein